MASFQDLLKNYSIEDIQKILGNEQNSSSTDDLAQDDEIPSPEKLASSMPSWAQDVHMEMGKQAAGGMGAAGVMGTVKGRSPASTNDVDPDLIKQFKSSKLKDEMSMVGPKNQFGNPTMDEGYRESLDRLTPKGMKGLASSRQDTVDQIIQDLAKEQSKKEKMYGKVFKPVLEKDAVREKLINRYADKLEPSFDAEGQGKFKFADQEVISPKNASNVDELVDASKAAIGAEEGAQQAFNFGKGSAQAASELEAMNPIDRKFAQLLEELKGLGGKIPGKLGELASSIQNSKAAQVAGDIASSKVVQKGVGVPLAAYGAYSDAKEAKEKFDKGDYENAAASGVGAVGNAALGAELLGSTAASGIGLPLVGMKLSHDLGNYVSEKMGGEYKGPSQGGGGEPQVEPPNQPGSKVQTSDYSPSGSSFGKDFHPPMALPQEKSFEDNEELVKEEQPSEPETSSEADSFKQQLVDNLLKRIQLEQGFSENNVANLKDIQDKARMMRMIEGVVNAAGEIGTGITGVKSGFNVAPTKISVLGPMADQMEKDFKDRIEAEKDDPNSQYSAGFRNMAKPYLQKLGLPENILDKMGGRQAGALLPVLQKDYESLLSKQFKDNYLKEQAKLRLDAQKEKRDDKIELQHDKNMKNFYDYALKPETLRTGNISKNKSIVDQGDRIWALIGKDPAHYKNVTEGQMFELIGAMDTMINQQSTVAGREHLKKSFETARAKLAGLARYGSNKPVPVGAEAFVKQIADTVKREQNTAQQKLNKFYDKITSIIPKETRKARKAEIDEFMNKLSDTELDFFTDAQEKAIEHVMKNNKVSREEAIEGLKNAGKL